MAKNCPGKIVPTGTTSSRKDRHQQHNVAGLELVAIEVLIRYFAHNLRSQARSKDGGE
jgi:hypothetical protein